MIMHLLARSGMVRNWHLPTKHTWDRDRAVAVSACGAAGAAGLRADLLCEAI